MAESNWEQKSYQRGYNRGYSTGQKNTGKYIDRTVRLRAALQQIADMDPKCERADDLGRAARVAREALLVSTARDSHPEEVGQNVGQRLSCSTNADPAAGNPAGVDASRGGKTK